MLRSLDAPLKHNYMEAAMNNMQQRVYWPPNVSGWEGGMSWLNTNTVQGRFDLVVTAQYLKYSNYYATGATTAAPGGHRGRDAAAAVRPRVRLGQPPWSERATRDGAGLRGELRGQRTAPRRTRRQRFYALQAMMLGGPDGQVM